MLEAALLSVCLPGMDDAMVLPASRVSNSLLDVFFLCRRLLSVTDRDQIGTDADRAEEHRRRSRQQAAQGMYSSIKYSKTALALPLCNKEFLNMDDAWRSIPPVPYGVGRRSPVMAWHRY